MKVIDLIIKGEYFDQIMAGTKTEEFREIRPSNVKKYCDYNPEIPWEENPYTPRHYDAIRFYVGYNKDRKSALIEIVKAEFEYPVDDDDLLIVAEEKGVQYVLCDVVYTLGKVIEKNF